MDESRPPRRSVTPSWSLASARPIVGPASDAHPREAVLGARYRDDRCSGGDAALQSRPSDLRHTLEHGIDGNIARPFDPNVTIGSELQDSSYRTLFVGTYLQRPALLHLAAPDARPRVRLGRFDVTCEDCPPWPPGRSSTDIGPVTATATTSGSRARFCRMAVSFWSSATRLTCSNSSRRERLTTPSR